MKRVLIKVKNENYGLFDDFQFLLFFKYCNGGRFENFSVETGSRFTESASYATETQNSQYFQNDTCDSRL